MSINLDKHILSGKIASYSFGEAYVPIRDLSGVMSKRMALNCYCVVIYHENGKRTSKEFDGKDWKQVKTQVEDFLKNI